MSFFFSFPVAIDGLRDPKVFVVDELVRITIEGLLLHGVDRSTHEDDAEVGVIERLFVMALSVVEHGGHHVFFSIIKEKDRFVAFDRFFGKAKVEQAES